MSSQFPPAKIVTFIEKNHVAGLALQHPDGGVWASSCFYVYDPDDIALIVLSNGRTRHVEAMRAHPAIAGTIAGQPQEIRKIQGIQFRAVAEEPDGERRRDALERYYKKFPMARVVPAEVWRLRLGYLKFTDNTLVFGQKTLWRRAETAETA